MSSVAALHQEILSQLSTGRFIAEKAVKFGNKLAGWLCPNFTTQCQMQLSYDQRYPS